MLLAGQRQRERPLYQAWWDWRRGEVAPFMMYSVTLSSCMLLAGRRQKEGRLFSPPRRCPASVKLPASLIHRLRLTGHRSDCGHLYPGCQSAPAWLLNNRFHDYSAPGLFGPWTIRSQGGLFGPYTILPQDHSTPELFGPWTIQPPDFKNNTAFGH